MLAEVLARNGQESSATQTWREALSDADHLGILHAVGPRRQPRPESSATAACSQSCCRRSTGRSAATGKSGCGAPCAADPRQLLADAVARRNLAGSRDVFAVIDARIRRRAGTLVPLPPAAWSGQVPETKNPGLNAYLAEIAGFMDARKQRIGEHAAASALPWAVGALGEVPEGPAARREWQRRASAIGAYRELSGHDGPAELIGPEPSANNPDLRAAWHEALAALGPVDGPDGRGMTDGLLLRLRDSYPVETAWAPPWAADELCRTRTAARAASLAALRARAEADAVRRRGEHERAGKHESLAASYQALRDSYRTRGTALATAMGDRTAWDRATRQQRQLAVAADAELRRRHPNQPWPELRSAEPQPMNATATPVPDLEEDVRLVETLAAEHREFADKLANRESIMVPAEDPDFEASVPAFPAWAAPARDAILQPPRPQIEPSARIRATNRDLDTEPAP